MTENERPFTGFIVSGEPVTTQKAREAGIIKKSKVTEKPEDYPMRTEPITQEDYVEMAREALGIEKSKE